MNFSAKLMKKNVEHFKIWLAFLLFIKILLETAQLLSKHFPSGLSLCILFFSFFIKARILLQFLSQAFSIFRLFSPIFFRFHKCFSNFHLSKNILINKFFFTEACVSSGICISQPPVFCLTSGPGPQFVFTSPGPRFLYTGPGL